MTVSRRNTAIEQVLDLLNAGDIQAARLLCRQILDTDNRSHQAMAQLGHLESMSGRHDQAVTLLTRAVALAPRVVRYHVKLGDVLATAGRNRAALLRYDKALKLEAACRSALAGKAHVHCRDRAPDKARRLLAPYVEAGTEDISMAIAYASASTGDGEYEQAIEVASRHVEDEAVWPIRQSLWFALGVAHENAGNYDEAFEAYTRGNRTNPAPVDSAVVSKSFDTLKTTFDRLTMRALPRASIDSELAIAIVGIYRSGSTLVEQIIDAHPKAHGAGELGLLADLVSGMSQRIGSTLPYPQCIRDLEQDDVDALGTSYLEGLRSLAPSAVRVCDKQLPNFAHLGVLAAILPRARIIHMRRDPLDTCLSCYVNRFPVGTPAVFGDLRALGMYYNDYLALMDHWRDVLDEPMWELEYEELVEDLEGVVRRLLEFCGLDWDDRCMHFFESKRQVLTLSRDQVNRPIYRSSVGRWRKFEKHLAPLREVLTQGLRSA